MSELDDKTPDSTATDAGSIDEQAEKLLRDIEGTSPFVLRTAYTPDDLDPSDVAAPAIEQPEQQEDFEEDAHMEVPVVQIVKDVEQVVADQEAAVAAEEHARLHRHRLRNTLILVVIILLIIASVIGVSIWRNSIAPDVKPSDTEALITSSTGTDRTAFQTIDKSLVPAFATMFGSSVVQAQEQTQGRMIVADADTAQTNPDVAAQVSKRDATIVNDSGTKFADVSLGLDKDGKIVFVRCVFDIDALGVADADFKTLLADSTVASSLLADMGVAEDLVQGNAVSLAEDQVNAINVTDGVERYEFAGSTGQTSAPTTWKLIETYDRNAGRANNDNSVIRTIEAQLL